MPILDIQRRIREVGRIRIGVQAPTRTGKRAPRKLDKFRLTSTDRRVIDAAAGIYGGDVNQWDNNGSTQWEVITNADTLSIALPPNPTDMAWTQFYETWAKGFCSRRCDGAFDTVRDRPCDCDPENRTCKATSRLSVLLPDIAGLGLWRLESHGYYAAVELAGAVDLITQMAGAHAVVPARLRLERREVRRLIDGDAKVFKFAVPVIDLDVSILGVREIAMGAKPAPELDEFVDQLAGLTPVPPAEPPAVLSVEQQVKEIETPKPRAKRANAPAPIPPTGRTAGRSPAEETCHNCGKLCGSDVPLVRDREHGGWMHRACKTTEAPATADDPPAEGPGGRGEGSPSAGTHDSGEPSPAPARAASQLQSRKLHATANELWPDADVDTRRRITLDIAAALGTPGLTSRTQLDRDAASVVIDALEGIRQGRLAWDDDGRQLIVVATGEIVTFEEVE